MSSSSMMSRRRWISATGAVAVGLPALELFQPRQARAASENAKFVAFYVPNGKHMDFWKPSTTGADFELTPTLEPLAALKQKIMLLSGLENEGASRRQGGDHARGTGSFLTAVNIHTDSEVNGGQDPNGISIDQFIADRVGQQSPIKSLQLGVHNTGRDQGYPGVFIQNVSFGEGGRAVPKTVRVDTAFEQVFAGVDPNANEEELARRRARKTSILDYVEAQASSLQPRLGASDKQKLDQYLSSVRELEQRIQNNANLGASCGDVMELDHPNEIPDQVIGMMDVIVLALQCGSTRVASYMLGNGGDGALKSFPWLNIPDHHHSFAHHGGREDNHNKIKAVDLWEVQQLAYLLEKMDSVPDIDGTLLDNSVVFYSSEISDGNRHNHDNLPVLLAGSGAGAFSPGRHLDFPGEPIAKAFVSIMNAMGVTETTFADGNGPLSDLA